MCAVPVPISGLSRSLTPQRPGWSALERDGVGCCQPVEGHVLGDGVVRDEEVVPRLAFVGLRVVARLLAPLHGGILLVDDLSVRHLVAALRLQHVDRGVRFGYEVRLVFRMVGTGLWPA